MRVWVRNSLIGGVLLSSFVFAGCGNTTTSGSGPVTQPIQQQPTTKDNQHHQGQPGKSNTSTSKSATGSTGGNNAKTGSTPSTGTTPTKTVTIHVGNAQGSTLSSVPVKVNGTGDAFVPVSHSVTAVQLPVGWTLQSNTYASTGTTIKWINPKDPSQYISESVQPFTRSLSNFYAAQSGLASWLIPNQVVEYTLSNPNNPNPDIGIMANNSNGGSIRLDVYLPTNEKNISQQIINSFVGTSN